MVSKKSWPPVCAPDFRELRPVLEHIRVMRRFLDEVIEPDPELRPFLDRIHGAYGDVLQTVLAPHALMLAVMLVELENHYTCDEASAHVQK